MVRTKEDFYRVTQRLAAFLPPIVMRTTSLGANRHDVYLQGDVGELYTSGIGVVSNCTMESKQKFASFLEDRGLLKEYIECMLQSSYLGGVDNLVPSAFIQHAFIWEMTSNGYTFWKRVSDEWVRALQ